MQLEILNARQHHNGYVLVTNTQFIQELQTIDGSLKLSDHRVDFFASLAQNVYGLLGTAGAKDMNMVLAKRLANNRNVAQDRNFKLLEARLGRLARKLQGDPLLKLIARCLRAGVDGLLRPLADLPRMARTGQLASKAHTHVLLTG